MQGEIFKMPNFVNTQHQRLSCTFLKSVLCSEFKNMFISIIFWFGVQLTIEFILLSKQNGTLMLCVWHKPVCKLMSSTKKAKISFVWS